MKKRALALSFMITLITAGCQSDDTKSINSTSMTDANKSGATIDVSAAAGPLAVNLMSAGNFVILSKSGITNTGAHTSVITGNIGSSPITAAAMSNVFCSEITGTIYGVDAAYVGSGDQTCFAGAPPAPNKTLVDNAVWDMANAYANAAGRTGPTATELGAGNIGGMTLAPGLYKWSTGVIIPTNVTLAGGANDVWIFQISGDLSIASGGSVPAGVKVLLTGGAKAANVFWQVGGGTGATLGTYSTFNGTILSAKQIIIQTGAVLHGRALAQTQVTLDAASISAPVNPPSVPPDTTTVPPDTTTIPPDTTTIPPDTTTIPPDTTTIPPDTSSGPLGEIRGQKFEDNNGDETLNVGDKLLCNWTIYLDTNNDGVLSPGKPSTVTKYSTGAYHFPGLPAGNYHVREIQQSGWTATYPSNGRHDITLTAGQVSDRNNFGNFHLGSISGKKFRDSNGNGSMNYWEVGLSGWTIVLQKVGGGSWTTTTNGAGDYVFTNIGPGVYNLSEVMQSGWTQTHKPKQVQATSGMAWNQGNFGNRRQ